MILIGSCFRPNFSFLIPFVALIMDTLRRRHLVHVVVFIIFIYFFEIIAGGLSFYSVFTSFSIVVNNNQYQYPIDQYGLPITIILYFLRLLALLPLPVAICHTCGLLFYNVFREKPDPIPIQQQQQSENKMPGICIRVVTRGQYPDLVRDNVARNVATCERVGLTQFILEVVTDQEMLLDTDARVRQTVVPSNYKTSTGALFKARALQYALETTFLPQNDFIVHLDEETLLTENCICGILHFIHAPGSCKIGQGLITYGNETVVNLITTLADSIRVGTDLGLLKFCLKSLHVPLFLFKGSYVVCQVACEREVTFDFGRRGSIAEDTYFAMSAMSKGYKFEWIEGEMMEKSPFTFEDMIRQRKRWLQGIFLVVHDSRLPLHSRFCLGLALYCWLTIPLTISNVFLTFLCPLNLHPIIEFLINYIAGVNVYLYVIGAIRSFHLARFSYFQFFLRIFGSIATIPLVIFCECIAVIWGLFGEKTSFYIVDKQMHPIVSLTNRRPEMTV